MPDPSPATLDDALTRDRGRLRRLQGAAQRGDAAAREMFEVALAASVAARAQRAARLPVPTFPEELPITAEAERLVALIQAHPVIVVAGETGSGKTTQLPKLCLAAGRGAAGMIGCTQPRRIAARSVARRVAEELGSTLGSTVGFQVRFTEQVSEHTAIKFMTDGILLAEIQSDRWLSRYDTIILDEAHERSLNIDFLLGFLKDLLPRRPDLKLIVTSATIDTARFAEHFGGAPVVSVEGRGFPVEIRWRPPQEKGGQGAFSPADLSPAGGSSQAKRHPGPLFAPGGEPEQAPLRAVPRAVRSGRGRARAEPAADTHLPLAEAIVEAVDEVTAEDPRGDVLVFLPGEREIRDAHLALSRRKYRHTEVLPLYARLSNRDQDRVFQPGPQRRSVLATNVAETSLTVPRIRYVIDPGVARVKRYSPRQKLDRLHVEPISQASANQRAGRCGRVAAGVCIRLYAEDDYAQRAPFTDPEIRRASLAGVILRMLTLGLGDIDAFPFLDAPDPRAIADGWQQLLELGAIESVAKKAASARQLTATGRLMARLPVDPKLSRMLVEAARLGCLREVLAIAAFLGIQDPRERPADQREAADAAHASFADPRSEFVAILKLWDEYQAQHEALTQSRLRDWCRGHYVSYLRMREWRELHRQLLVIGGDLGWQLNDKPAEYPELHMALLSGLPTQVGHRNEKQVYEGPRQRRFRLFPGSSVAKAPPPWVLAAVILDTRQVYALTNARVEPEWIVRQAAHLVARRHSDPHWSRKHGSVRAYEQVTLFGLLLSARKPVQYAPLAPAEARQIFIRDGMVANEVDCRAPFLARNYATLLVAAEEEAKLRRAGLVADADWQAEFYDRRLPPEVSTAKGLDAWYHRLNPAQKQDLEWSVEDLLPSSGSDAARFPKSFALGEQRLPLSYRFEPAAADDGVTLSLPLHLLNALDGERLQWLVPGLLEDKVVALIRGLPKSLRRNFVPAPDFARAFVESAPAVAGTLTGALAHFLERATGVEVPVQEWNVDALPPHLRFNIRLLEGERVLSESRDLDALRQRFGELAQAAFAARAGRDIARTEVQEFPPEGVPEQVPGDAGVPAWPALVDAGDAVALQVFPEPEEARAAHAGGVRRLLRAALADRLRQARRQLPVSPKLGLLYAAIEAAPAHPGDKRAPLSERFREDIVEGAFAALAEGQGGLAGVRSRSEFDARVVETGRALFPLAMQRLQLAETILAAVAALKPQLEPELIGFARGNYDDLQRQLARLVHPGFLRETPLERLGEYPRYLKAMALRAERLPRDPARDQVRMLEVRPFEQALDAASAAGDAADPRWQALRWRLEEWRVSLFAQELGTREAVSAKRLTRDLAELQGS